MLNDYEGIHRPFELGLAAFIIPFAEALIKEPCTQTILWL